MRLSVAVAAIALLSACESRTVGDFLRTRPDIDVQPLPSDCPHLPDGLPVGLDASTQFTCRDDYAFAIAVDSQTQQPDFVAYCVAGADDTDAPPSPPPPPPPPLPDPDVPPDDLLQPDDYENVDAIGYELGRHFPPSLPHTDPDSPAYAVNLAPRSADLEAVWRDLEAHQLELLNRHGSLCAITGPFFFDGDTRRLPSTDKSHRLPAGYWILLTLPDGSRQAYVYEQETPPDTDFRLGRTELFELESFAGLVIVGD
ncbi:hypothetical protein [Lyngbya sp. CCY1209]|uniref:hypothetical protein n=1 Tax=Lyngbya sp. CCY1209 TaxID=2886103 RepID=UPI002D2051C0|nr:hypothetical protein [Lyngbya sp. CCY1209]MEB3884083.1 hypothetical protein [Lyngbya sp. CCY1209]